MHAWRVNGDATVDAQPSATVNVLSMEDKKERWPSHAATSRWAVTSNKIKKRVKLWYNSTTQKTVWNEKWFALRDGSLLQCEKVTAALQVVWFFNRFALQVGSLLQCEKVTAALQVVRFLNRFSLQDGSSLQCKKVTAVLQVVRCGSNFWIDYYSNFVPLITLLNITLHARTIQWTSE